MKLVGSTQSIVGIVMLTGFYAAKENDILRLEVCSSSNTA
jgi:hypothetical protein